jgi:hypothetical protein
MNGAGLARSLQCFDPLVWVAAGASRISPVGSSVLSAVAAPPAGLRDAWDQGRDS